MTASATDPEEMGILVLIKILPRVTILERESS